MRTNINSKRSQNQNASKGEERNINKGQGGYTGGTNSAWPLSCNCCPVGI